jgi:hypothetical protein
LSEDPSDEGFSDEEKAKKKKKGKGKEKEREEEDDDDDGYRNPPYYRCISNGKPYRSRG